MRTPQKFLAFLVTWELAIALSGQSAHAAGLDWAHGSPGGPLSPSCRSAVVTFFNQSGCRPAPLSQCTGDLRASYEWQAVCNAQILPARAVEIISQTPDYQPIDWRMVITRVPSTNSSDTMEYVRLVWGTPSTALPETVPLSQLNNASLRAAFVPAALPKAASSLRGNEKNSMQELAQW
eukprot:jgi/Botrbrau1/4691/Bobra.0218s0013.1